MGLFVEGGETGEGRSGEEFMRDANLKTSRETYSVFLFLFLVFEMAVFPRLSELAKPARSSLFLTLFKSNSP